ncbi:MAG: thioredoxin domain-containing protein [Deferribacteraceae bacterium]|jgi:protein-disulfide isomerase|nr:thioredoxin domain-containing protein [Deferribacteraceae bacterium]
MKGVFLVVLSMLLLSGSAFALTPAETDAALQKSVTQTMAARGMEVLVDVARVQEMKDLKGFYYYKITVKDKKKPAMSQDQYLFFNGTYIVPDFINAASGASLAKDLKFDLSITDIDTSKLSLIYGKRGAKNTIVKITDFECPYCRKANEYIESLVKGRNDVAIYIMHLPLKIHKKAIPFAEIFEAGNIMGKNFSHELFSDDKLLAMTDEEVINYFAAKSGDAAKFKGLLKSEQVQNILKNSQTQTEALAITATPVIFINGKRVDGFDQALINKGFSGF